MKPRSYLSRLSLRLSSPGELRNPLRRFLCLAVCLSVWASCSRDPKALAGGWTDTDTGTKVSGLIIREDGRPAAGALVLLRPADYLGRDPSRTDSLGYSQSKGTILDGTCDSSGHFTFDSVLVGRYYVEARERELKAALIKFELNEKGGALALPAATVHATGIITGQVVFSDSVSGPVLVRIFGLERALVANHSGSFTIGGIPAGTYTLQFSSLEPYTPPVEKTLVVVAPDSGTDAGEIRMARTLKQSFRIVDGYLDIPGVDSTNPVIFENGAFLNPVDGAYLWAKASLGRLDLRGTMVSYSTDTGDVTLQANLRNCARLVKWARQSGMTGVLDPVAGSQHKLVRALSGNLEDIVPEPCEGSRLLIKEARKASMEKPLVVICGANLTTVADALLQDPTIADRMVVFGANNNNYNNQDTLALAVVAKKARFVTWARDYIWSRSGSLWREVDPFPTNRLGQELFQRFPKDTIKDIWSFAYFGDFGPATFLYQRKVWNNAQGADFAGYPLLATVPAPSPYDFVDVPIEANDWNAIEDEFFSAINDPAAYHPWPISGGAGVEAENFGSSQGVKLDSVTAAPSDAETWTGTASWAEYKVQVDAAGDYSLDIRNQSALPSIVKIMEKESGASAAMDLPASTAWDTVTMVLHLEPGTRTLRVESQQAAFTLDWIRIHPK